jgi:hypothetical protein
VTITNRHYAARANRKQAGKMIPPDEPDEFEQRFDQLVEHYVRQREIETPLTKPPTAKRAAQSTYDAVLWVLREYGIARLDDQWMRPRLANFSTTQLKELVAAMERMRPRYPQTITSELISALKEFYDVATKR